MEYSPREICPGELAYFQWPPPPRAKKVLPDKHETKQRGMVGLRKAKALLSEIWWRTRRSIKKGFYRCISSNRKAMENVCLLLNGLWDLWQRIKKRSRNSVSSLPQSFNCRICLQESHVLWNQKVWRNKDLTLARSGLGWKL